MIKKLKEYRVETVDNIYSKSKYAKEFEDILNNQAVEGWEFKLAVSFYLIFEREKE